MAGRIADTDRAQDAARQESCGPTRTRSCAPSTCRHGTADLETLADAAWWLSRSDESVTPPGSGPTPATWPTGTTRGRSQLRRGGLCMEHFFRGEPALAAGWLMRQRLLRDQPERVQHGYCWRRVGLAGGSRRDR